MKQLLYILSFIFVVFATQGITKSYAKNVEWNTDRPGLDFSNFNLPQANPKLCKIKCDGNPKCKAWTYVKPNTIQGPNPRCWLKHAVPAAKKNSCCVSGTKAPKPPGFKPINMEWNTDRPGSDFSNFNLPNANPQLCKNKCASNPKCKAWTYVKPNTIQGPNPRCWLKHSIPAAKKNTCCISGRKVLKPPVTSTGKVEWNIDRPGSDFSNFNLPKANPILCRNKCAKNPKCKAWTYVRPHTTQGPNPRCWLKYAVPAASKNACCVSGVKAATAPVAKLEWNIDRPGSDFSNFNLPKPNPHLCRAKCASNSKCKAWTYVRPHTTQGPNPRCWLKYAVPAASKNACCVSGIK